MAGEIPRYPVAARRPSTPGGCISGDQTLGHGKVGAADPRNLARTVDARNAALLKVVDHDCTVAHVASDESRQLDIGRQAEAAGKNVARFGPGAAAALKRDRLDLHAAVRGGRPAACQVARVPQQPAITDSLVELVGREQEEFHAKTGHAAPGRLFCHHGDVCAALSRVCGDGEQQWPAAGDDDPFAFNGPARFEQGLQASGADHVGQGPTRKGKKPLASSCRQNQLLIAKFERFARLFGQ